jgi:hypothetical protein
MSGVLRPWEQGRSFASQFTARRMNDLQRAIRPVRYSGAGLRVSHIGGQTFVTAARQTAVAAPAKVAWPFKVYNTTTGSTGQVQLNGGDGSVAQLNGFVFNVGGSPTDAAPYPQLAVTGNGVIYGYAIPTTPGVASPLSNGDIYYAGSLPSLDTANPATYFPFLIATISNYAVDGSGNVSFDVNNAYGSAGPSTLIYCGPGISIY